MYRWHLLIIPLVSVACGCGDPTADLVAATDDMVTFVDEAARTAAPETVRWDGDGVSEERTCSTGTGTVFVSYQLTAEVTTEAEARALFARVEDHLTSDGRDDVEPGLARTVEITGPGYSITAWIDDREGTAVHLGASTACFGT